MMLQTLRKENNENQFQVTEKNNFIFLFKNMLV